MGLVLDTAAAAWRFLLLLLLSRDDDALCKLVCRVTGLLLSSTPLAVATAAEELARARGVYDADSPTMRLGLLVLTILGVDGADLGVAVVFDGGPSSAVPS